MKKGVPQGSILDPSLSLLYAHNLSETINGKSKLILYSGDTNIIFTNSNPEDFKNDIKIELDPEINS